MPTPACSLLSILLQISCIHMSRGLVQCTIDETLAVVNNSVACKPVDCVAVYGTLRPSFNPITGLCVAQPSPPPSPSTGALPNNASGTKSPTCIHGSIVCSTSCTCECAEGWTTTIDAGTVFGLVYCNVSSANTGGGIVGQTSTGASCSSAVACFFVDELPYVLAVLGIMVLCLLCCTCIGFKCCCPKTSMRDALTNCCCCLCRSLEPRRVVRRGFHAGSKRRRHRDTFFPGSNSDHDDGDPNSPVAIGTAHHAGSTHRSARRQPRRPAQGSPLETRRRHESLSALGRPSPKRSVSISGNPMNHHHRGHKLGALGDERSPGDRDASIRAGAGLTQAADDSRSQSTTDHHWLRGQRRGSLDRTLPSYVKHAAFGPRRQERVSVLAVGEQAAGRRRHSDECATTASAGRGTSLSQSEQRGEIHSSISFATRLAQGHRDHEGRAPDAVISVRVDDETPREEPWAPTEHLPGISERRIRGSRSAPASGSSGSTSQQDAASSSSPQTPTETLQRKSHLEAQPPETSDRSSGSRSSSSASGRGSSRSMAVSEATDGESPGRTSHSASPDPVAPGATSVEDVPRGLAEHAGERLEAHHDAPRPRYSQAHKHLGAHRSPPAARLMANPLVRIAAAPPSRRPCVLEVATGQAHAPAEQLPAAAAAAGRHPVTDPELAQGSPTSRHHPRIPASSAPDAGAALAPARALDSTGKSPALAPQAGRGGTLTISAMPHGIARRR